MDDFDLRLARMNRRIEAVGVLAICLLALLVAGVFVRAAVLHWMASNYVDAAAMVVLTGLTAVIWWLNMPDKERDADSKK